MADSFFTAASHRIAAATDSNMLLLTSPNVCLQGWLVALSHRPFLSAHRVSVLDHGC